MKRIFIAATITLACLSAHAFDDGRYKGSDPKIREWFKSVRSPSGIPCCDIADGHKTEWRGDGNGGYEVRIDGQWLTVPKEAVVRDAGNPLGEAIVWYSPAGYGSGGELPRIRCFVPGTEG